MGAQPLASYNGCKQKWILWGTKQDPSISAGTISENIVSI